MAYTQVHPFSAPNQPQYQQQYQPQYQPQYEPQYQPQYQPRAQQFAVTNQPQYQPQVRPFHDLNNEWTVGLCECCNNCGQCCYAYFCWCCFVGSLAKDIDESMCSCCCLMNVLAVYRMKVRAVLKIRGDSCSDCCVVCWCPCCAALQMRNELKNRGMA
ncbi:unnamed protein product [Adineta steineri]|uniref:Uncharacterized protein n=1 Tax=Adineta steineri TaxID=433720 RepID=A0A813Q5E6_9BILA|nr:unnamed protein product [Adineta steineri]CAF4108700.1 unnamed protein product [Adineta steineri]